MVFTTAQGLFSRALMSTATPVCDRYPKAVFGSHWMGCHLGGGVQGAGRYQRVCCMGPHIFTSTFNGGARTFVGGWQSSSSSSHTGINAISIVDLPSDIRSIGSPASNVGYDPHTPIRRRRSYVHYPGAMREWGFTMRIGCPRYPGGISP